MDGTYKKTPIPGGVQKKHISLTTYYYMWQRDYDYLKVSRPAEDICSLCYQFAHRAKFMSCLGVSHTATTNDDDDLAGAFNNLNINSSVDDALFRDDPEPPSTEESEDAEEELYADEVENSRMIHCIKNLTYRSRNPSSQGGEERKKDFQR